MPVGHLQFLFEKRSIQFSAHFSVALFVFLMLSCMSCLYVLNINPLSVRSFANILSHSVDCLFYFVNDFLCCAKDFKFN